MNKTTRYYLKDILKTTGKVALLAGVTAVATPYAFGFAAGFFNSMFAGYIVGGSVLGIGAWKTVKTLAKDVISIRSRVKKKQEEEELKEHLKEVREAVKEIKAKKAHQKDTEKQPEVIEEQEVAPKTKKRKINPFLWKRGERYDRAA